jgi:hypothetical protein
MAWRWRALAMGAWFGVACGDDPAETESASTSSGDDDADDDVDDESEDDDPVVEDGTDSSTGVDPSAGSSSGSPESSDDGVDASTSSGDGSRSTSSGSTSSEDTSGDGTASNSGTDTDPTGGALECDPFAQDCAPGEKCSAWADDGGSSWNATHCVPVDPDPAQPGEPCVVRGSGVSGIDNCDVGVMCWNVDPFTLMGTCVALCTGSVDDPVCEDDAASCQISNDDALNLCLPMCHPLLDDCPAGEGCYPGDEAFHCSSDASGAAGAQGDECMFVNVCDPGLACIDGDFVGCSDPACCSSFCDFTDPTACTDAGLFCIPWYEEGQAPPGFEVLGICGSGL